MIKKALSIFFILSVFCLNLEAAEGTKKTVCLNMIVKNESKIIKECLESAKPLIDYWVIVDTGSTDGTQDIIKEFFKGVPGELHEKPWINFAYNRNEALALAKGKADYLLILDADDKYVLEPKFKLPALTQDAYHIPIEYNGLKYTRLQLIKADLNWNWVGVVHEVLVSPQATNIGKLEGIKYVCSREGDRSRDPKKYHKDAELLEAAVKENPSSTRDQFYLAQSYRDAGEHALALKNYEKRVELGGWDEEVFISLLNIARLQENLGLPEETIVRSYYKAFSFRPSRVEPLYSLANFYRRKEQYAKGYKISEIALGIPVPDDVLFIEKWAYDYDVLLENSICAYWIGFYKESRDASLKLLSKKGLPPHVRTCVLRNLGFSNQKLVEKVQNVNSEGALAG